MGVSGIYRYAIWQASNLAARTIALALMKQVPRWQKQDGSPTDPEQYISRQGAESGVEVILIYDNQRHESVLIGSAFVGKVEGYDREKTQAMIVYGKGDETVLDRPTVWLNYQSWEEIPGRSPTAFSSKKLPGIWSVFADACTAAFPEAEQVVARSRYYEVWSHVYTPPWRVLAEVDLRGFSWTAPDNKTFSGYDERFSRYGILGLSLR